jgi:hypothetical protein
VVLTRGKQFQQRSTRTSFSSCLLGMIFCRTAGSRLPILSSFSVYLHQSLHFSYKGTSSDLHARASVLSVVEWPRNQQLHALPPARFQRTCLAHAEQHSAAVLCERKRHRDAEFANARPRHGGGRRFASSAGARCCAKKAAQVSSIGTNRWQTWFGSTGLGGGVRVGD